MAIVTPLRQISPLSSYFAIIYFMSPIDASATLMLMRAFR